MINDNLIMTNVGLVRKVSWLFCKSTGLPYEDLFQEGYIAYLKASETYDPNKGAFSTYAWWCITNHLKNYLRLENVHNKNTYDVHDDYNLLEIENDQSNYFEVLPADCQEIAEVILTSPNLYICQTREGVERRLKIIMEHKGWPRSKTKKTIEKLHKIYS